MGSFRFSIEHDIHVFWLKINIVVVVVDGRGGFEKKKGIGNAG
jgi:hypothetical protein